jgi:predicted DCC family thiol-disulfide oxidoreductase YuxK
MLSVLYDGQCVICNTSRRVVSRLDWRRAVAWVDLHAPEAARQFADIPHAQAMGQVHVREENGRTYAGFLGTRRMLKELPLTFPLWLLLQVPGMTWLGHRVYRWIARNRYAVNRMFGAPVCENDTCRIN